MSPRPWETRFQDILTCAYNIRAFTENMSLDSFLVDPKSIRAVAFEFVTMDEATRAIPDDIRQQYPQIPWDKMQGLRNILVHEYFRIDEEILWQSSIEDIPQLIRELENSNSPIQAILTCSIILKKNYLIPCETVKNLHGVG